jgi:hypothetical protein
MKSGVDVPVWQAKTKDRPEEGWIGDRPPNSSPKKATDDRVGIERMCQEPTGRPYVRRLKQADLHRRMVTLAT